jgi:hypothetical protein
MSAPDNGASNEFESVHTQVGSSRESPARRCCAFMPATPPMPPMQEGQAREFRSAVLRLHASNNASYLASLAPASAAVQGTGWREGTICNTSGRSVVALVHVYKASGTFLRQWLAAACPSHVRTLYDDEWLAAAASLARARLVATPAARSTVVALVRNPVDRLVSARDELISRGAWSAHQPLSDLIARMERRGIWNPHLAPQVFFLLDRDGMPHPITYLGRAEFADEARVLLLDRLKAPRETKLSAEAVRNIARRASERKPSAHPSISEVCAAMFTAAARAIMPE